MAKTEIEIVVETSKRRKQLQGEARSGFRPVRIVRDEFGFNVGVHRSPVEVVLMAGPFITRKAAVAACERRFLRTPPVRTTNVAALTPAEIAKLSTVAPGFKH